MTTASFTVRDLPLEQLRIIARRYGLLELSVFGSVARGEAGPDSDVDLLFVRGPDTPLGTAFFSLRDELADLMGRKVDLVPKTGLHWVIRNDVIAEALVLYAST